MIFSSSFILKKGFNFSSHWPYYFNLFYLRASHLGKSQNKIEVNLLFQLTLSPDHLKLLEKRVYDKHHDKFFCGLRRGPHVFILSLLSLPFVWLYSTLQAFILGSMTLFNIFVYYNEERTCCLTLLSPFVLLLYPFWIIPVTLLLGIYAAFIQVSHFYHWNVSKNVLG